MAAAAFNLPSNGESGGVNSWGKRMLAEYWYPQRGLRENDSAGRKPILGGGRAIDLKRGLATLATAIVGHQRALHGYGSSSRTANLWATHCKAALSPVGNTFSDRRLI
jgi:hypothetical protein